MHGTMKLLVDKILEEGLEQSNIANCYICELSKPFVSFWHDAYGIFHIRKNKTSTKELIIRIPKTLMSFDTFFL
jgi:hypothetical protein